jgi:hypothetical protein
MRSGSSIAKAFYINRTGRRSSTTHNRIKKMQVRQHTGGTSVKSLLSKVIVTATLALATTVGAHAQNTATVEYGRTILAFDPSFTSSINSLGATIGGVGFSSVDNSGTIVFPVVCGALDLQTGRGEIEHLGGLSVVANGLQLRLQNLILDTTGSPVLTAMLVVNNKLIGRFPLFDIAVPPSTSLPLQTTVGVLQINGFGVTFNATGAATINAVFGNNAVPAGMKVGTLNVYAVISPSASN